jgi:hypothetical protein
MMTKNERFQSINLSKSLNPLNPHDISSISAINVQLPTSSNWFCSLFSVCFLREPDDFKDFVHACMYSRMGCKELWYIIDLRSM